MSWTLTALGRTWLKCWLETRLTNRFVCNVLKRKQLISPLKTERHVSKQDGLSFARRNSMLFIEARCS